MPLIIHADDFGKDESVSRCIVDVMRRGWCSETSLMVNMPFADSAVELARKEGFSQHVGLHLNLTHGMPLTDDIRNCQRFCNADGMFNKFFHLRMTSRLWLSARERRAVAKELEAQLEKFLSYSGLLRHLDSHHHVHTDWSVYQILKPMLHKYGFTHVRLSATLHKVGFLMALYKQAFNASVRAAFATADEFDGFQSSVIPAVKEGKCVELMVHPLYSPEGEILDAARPYAVLMEQISSSGLDWENWNA